MSRSRCTLVLAVLLCLGVSAGYAESHLMRMADVSADQIVFTYEEDLWLVPIAGGPARRITSDPGAEVWPKFSPDGKQIAFTGQYDGGTDVYVMDDLGSPPRRLTYHGSADLVLGWWPDGQSVLFRSRRAYPSRGEEIYRVPLAGGATERLPVDRGGLASVSPDGKSIVYNRISREAATWKRHRGGDSQRLWMGSLEKHDYQVISDSDWTSNFPMWHEDGGIYFNSDREDGTLNLYRYDVASGQTRRLTQYRDYDVKYPSIGPKHIVYQYGESLHLLEIATGKSWLVPVEIPSDRVPIRPELVKVAPATGSFSLSPTGVRVLLEARGDILNLPAEDGEPINLTASSGSREKNAAWSPDGRWIAFISDRSGEEEVYLVDQRAEKPWKQLTKGGQGFRMQLVWSPDSHWLLFADKFMRLNLVNAESGEISVVDQGDLDDGWERWGIQDYVWSPDSQWIAYTKLERTVYESIFLHSLKDHKSHRLTGETTEDWSPSFDPEGRYLYFLSNRTFTPQMCFVDQEHIFHDMARPYVILLQADAVSPFAPKDSEEKAKEEPANEKGEAEAKKESADEEPKAEPDKDGGSKAKGADEPKPVKIDLEGIERRIVVAEDVPAGNYFRLQATKKGFLYLAKTEPEFEKYQVVTDQTGGKLNLHHYNLEDAKATEVLSGIANYHLSADLKKLVYRAGTTYGVVDAGTKAALGDGKVDCGAIKLSVDRSAEFLQMFNEAWRIQRDWFYDPNMHGLDWAATGEKYRKFVPFCGNRSDLNYLIGEMIGELNIGHTYVWGGDLESTDKRVSVGYLGADFAAEPGVKYYRVKHILPGTPGDADERSPLADPGCPIKEGDYLIRIDGQEITTSEDLYRFLQDKADKVVTLAYSREPSADGLKTWRVKTIGGEMGLRYREWVDRNRAYVDKMTNGEVGYLHLPDMGENGVIEFAKAWYPQFCKKGFVIDARYNGGGFTSGMIIDRLERRIWALSKPREGAINRDPERVFVGPWVVLINEDTGSDGEMFTEAIKIKKMAPAIGMRTWGGSIGIEAHQDLVDGGTVTPPQFGLYGLNSKWLIEGRGVEPDIEVQNLPGDVLAGKDAQLDAGIQNVLQRMKEDPVNLPPPPPYPNKARPAGS